MTSITPIKDDPESDLQRAEEAIAETYKEFDAAYALQKILEDDSGDLTKDKAALAAIQDTLNELKNKWGLDIDTNLADYTDGNDVLDKIQAAIDLKWLPYNVPSGVGALYQTLEWAFPPGSHLSPEAASLIDLHNKQKAVDAAEKELAAIDPDIKDILAEVNALMNSLATGQVSDRFMKQDLATITQYFAPLFKAMTEKLHADEDEQLISEGGNGPLSDAQIAALYLDLANTSIQEQSTLFDLEDQMTQGISDWRDVEHKADQTIDGTNGWTDFTTDDFFGIARARLREEKSNGQRMEATIQNLMTGLSSEIGSISSSGMNTITMMLDMIMRDVRKIWASDSSGKEKKDQILNCFAIVLSLLSAIQSTVSAERAEFDKRVSEAMQKASVLSVQDTISQQKEMDILKGLADKMKTVVFIAKVLMTFAVIMLTLCTAGVFAAGAAATLGALDMSGGIDNQSLLDKGKNNLAELIQKIMDESKAKNSEDLKNNPYSDASSDPSKTAQIIAEVIMGASEAMFLGGVTIAAAAPETAIADAALEAAEVAAATAIQEAEEQIGQAVQRILGTMVQEEIQTNAAQATETLNKQLLDKTLELVTRKTTQMVARSGSWKELIQLTKGTYKPLIEAAEAAIKETVLQSEMSAEMALKGSLTPELIEEQSQKIANRAVADAMGSTEEDVAEATSKTAMDIAVKQAAWMSVYTMSNSNFLLDAVEKLMKDSGLKEDDKTFEAIQALMQTIQVILAMAGMMMAYNGPQLLGEGMPVWVSRIATLSQVTSSATTAVAEGSQAGISQRQARIVPKIAKDKASIDAFQLMLKKLFQSQNGEQDRFSTEASSISQSGAELIRKGLLNNDDAWRALSTAV